MLLQAQLRPATPAASQNESSDQPAKVPRLMPAPKREVSIRRGDAFMIFYPGAKRMLTYGIDHTEEAPVIGKQWYSWALAEDDHFRFALAPAKTFNISPLVSCPSQWKARFVLFTWATVPNVTAACMHALLLSTSPWPVLQPDQI